MRSHIRANKVLHTILRRGVYHYNRRIPAGYLRLSLQTRDYRVAMGLAGRLSVFIEEQIGRGMKYRQLKQIASVWLQEELERAFVNHAQDGPLDSPDQVKQEQDWLLSTAGEWNDALNSRQYGDGLPLVTAMEQRYSLNLSKPDRRTLAALLCLANRELYERQGRDDWPSLLATHSEAMGDAQQVVCGRRLSELYEEYADIKIRSGKWGAKKTVMENRAAFSAGVELMGDIPVSELDKAMARKYARTLLRYPLNRNKGKLKERPIEDLLADDSLPRPSPQRLNNLFSKYASFIKWLKRQQYIAENYLEDMNPSGFKKGDTNREPFDSEDLRLLFSTSIHARCKFKRPYDYWLPLMGLYTGARLNEICQLDVADIVEAENPKCAIRITEDAREDAEETSGMNKRLKTKAGDRTVPIHAHLLELGFMEYVKSRPPEGKLFDVKYYAETETWAHDAGKHFSGFKTKLGFGKNKVFHSFRHTMVGALADEGVEDPKLRAIVGHEQDAVTYKVYKKSGFKPHLLNVEVQKVNWREELAAVRPWSASEK